MLRTTTQFTPRTNFSKANNPPAYSVQQQRQGATFVEVSDLQHFGSLIKEAKTQVMSENQDAFLNQCVDLIHEILNLPNTSRLRLKVGFCNELKQNRIKLLNPNSDTMGLMWTLNPEKPWEIITQLESLLKRTPEIVVEDPLFASGPEFNADYLNRKVLKRMLGR